MEAGEFAVDAEVVIALLGEVDAWVEDEVIEGETGAEGETDFFVEEIDEGFDDVGVADMGMRDLGLADAVHDEQAGVVLGAEAGVGGVGQGADVVDEVDAVGENRGDDFGAPSIDGEQGRPGLLGVPDGATEAGDEGGEGVYHGYQAVDFFLDADGASVGAGTFGSEVDDVGSGFELLFGLGEGAGGVECAIAAEGVVIDIDDAHDQGATGEGEGVMTGAPDHFVGGQEAGRGTIWRWP